MQRPSFKFQGKEVTLYRQADGWRYYQTADESFKIRCKGFNVEQV